MHTPPPLHVMDYIGPALGALGFVALASLLREPLRHRLSTVFVAGAAGVYLSGGFGAWELLFPALFVAVVYRGLSAYPFIGVAWLLHAAWDLAHHLYGNPIWPFMPTSSFGCLIFDAAIALWYFAGAPAIYGLLHSAEHSPHGGP
jgi:hypothetical protein